MGLGDPHYVLLDGSFVTCNELGWQNYAVAERNLWTVEVYHSTVTTVNSAVATKITNIRVTIGADYVFTFPKEGWVPEVINIDDEKVINITDSSIAVDTVDLFLTMTVHADNSGGHMVIGISSGSIASGIVKDGCPSAGSGSGSGTGSGTGGGTTGSGGVSIAPQCSGLDSLEFQLACSFDVAATNDNSFVTSAQSASTAFQALAITVIDIPEAPTSSSSSHVAIIVGVAVGVVCVGMAVVAAMLFLKHQKRSKKAAVKRLSQVQPS